MKVFIVLEHYDCESDINLKVCSTYELAKKFLDETMDFSGSPDRYFIEEWEIDKDDEYTKREIEFVNDRP